MNRARLRTAGARLTRRAHRALRALAQVRARDVPGVVMALDWSADQLVVSGWSALSHGDIHHVLIRFDGDVVGVAPVGLPTPVVGGQPATRASAMAGWQLAIPGGVLEPGRTIEVTAAAVVNEVLLEELMPAVLVVPAPPTVAHELQGAIDPPDGVAPLGAPLHLTGWVRLAPGFQRVELAVGERTPESARLFIGPHPAVAADPHAPWAPAARWELVTAVPPSWEGTKVPVAAEVVHAGGRSRLGAVEVDIAPASTGPDAADLERAVTRFQERTNALLASRAPRNDGPTHVLVVTHALTLGGGQLYLHELLRRIRHDERLRFTVLAQTGGVLRSELEAWGIDTFLVGGTPTDAVDYEMHVRDLAHHVAAIAPDVVLANTAGTFAGADVALRAGLPVIWTIHESYQPQAFLGAALGAVSQHVADRFEAALRGAHRLVFEADATSDLFADVAPAQRRARIDYGIDIEAIDRFVAQHDRARLRADRGYAPDDVVLLVMGTFEPRKSQAFIELAFGAVAAESPHAHLALVGDTGSPYATTVHHVAHRLDLGHRLHIEGVVEDVLSWYLTADWLVTASDVESLPRSMLEAMAVGVPVLASSVFGIPEMIDDGQTGLLVGPRDMCEIIGGLRRALAMEEHDRVALGDAGRSLVRRTRDSRGYADAIAELLSNAARAAGTST